MEMVLRQPHTTGGADHQRQRNGVGQPLGQVASPTQYLAHAMFHNNNLLSRPSMSGKRMK